MAQPTTNTNGILISSPASVPTPAIGYVTYFFNTSDNNALYYKTADGTVLIGTSTSLVCDPCLCADAAKTLCAWNQGLLEGTLTQVQYSLLVASGMVFKCTNGVDTQTLTIGVGTLPSSTIFTLPVYANDAAAGVGGLVRGQLYQTAGGVVMIKQ